MSAARKQSPSSERDYEWFFSNIVENRLDPYPGQVAPDYAIPHEELNEVRLIDYGKGWVEIELDLEDGSSLSGTIDQSTLRIGGRS